MLLRGRLIHRSQNFQLRFHRLPARFRLSQTSALPSHARRSPFTLVNKSDSDLKLYAQDGDIFLKLETMTDTGFWQRAQPHAYSWCGNSYFFSPVVKKGHFMKIEGYQPRRGRKAKIRFRLYGQYGLDLTSQEGDGIVLDSDIAKASSDALAVSSGTFDFVVSVALGEKKLKNTLDHITDLQGYAISQLGSERFPTDKVLPLLEKILLKFPNYKRDINFARRQIYARKKNAEQGVESNR